MKSLNKHALILANGIKDRGTHIMSVPIFILIFTMSTLVACNSGAKSSPQDQPPAQAAPAVNAVPDGAALLDERCSSCHSASKPKQARKTIDQWDKTVSRMISKGVRLTETEKAVLLAYLEKTYGP